MSKIAFVFAGQGSQFTGMGKTLYEESEAARSVFDMAQTLRPGTIEQCFGGSDEILSLTENTQPCLFAMDLAAAKALSEELSEAGIEPDALAGFSLGELAALTYADAFSNMEAGFKLVCKRGKAMSLAAEKEKGTMAAVLKLKPETVEELCAGFEKIYPVNYNCPGQLVVAGKAEEMESFAGKVTSAGGRFMPLKVSGGFHSPLMEEAAQAVKEELKVMNMNIPKIPVYSNVTAQPYDGSSEGVLKGLLYMQTKSPVRWQETIENMAKDGIDTFIEVGAGKTLCGLIKKTIKGANVMNIQEAADIAAVKEKLL